MIQWIPVGVYIINTSIGDTRVNESKNLFLNIGGDAATLLFSHLDLSTESTLLVLPTARWCIAIYL